MSKRSIRKYTLIGLSLILILTIVASCTSSEEEGAIPAPEEFSCTAIDDEVGYDPIQGNIDQYEPGIPVVPSQVVITGIPNDIGRILEHELVIGYELFPTLDESIQIPTRPNLPDDLESNLYTINTGASVSEVIQAIYQVILEIQDPEEPIVAFAHPNLLVGAPLGIDADPLGIDADPLGIDADALSEVEGTEDFELPGETAEGPWDQWALRSDFGISVYDNSSDPAVSELVLNEVYGDGIDVYIFDTSPFEMTSEQTVMDRKLCVYHPPLVNEIEGEDTNIKQHGYFSAGLVRFVAPNSRLHLIRVLNEQGVGDIFSYVVVLNDLMVGRGDMNNSVVNLSLSLHEFADEDTAAEFLPDDVTLEAILANLPPEYEPVIKNPEAVINLVTDQAFYNGAVIVAASGNDSNLTNSPPEISPTGIPANRPVTVGVAGSDINKVQACFSNEPELEMLAPSGDGVDREAATEADRENQCEFPFPWLPEGDSCPPSLSDGYDCKYALTSVVTTDLSDSGFAHWLGTSFATPLVGGTAVLMLDAGRDVCNARQITTWLQSFKGVVQVPDALEYALSGC